MQPLYRFPDFLSCNNGSFGIPDVCWRGDDVISLRQHIVFSSILAALFIIDILTTEQVLSLGGGEINPFMVWVTSSMILHAVIKALLIALVIAVAHVADERVPRSGVGLYCVLILMYCGVIMNNIYALGTFYR